MIGRLLAVNALILLVWMSLWFLAAKRRGRLDTVDTAWGTAFIVSAWAVVIQHPHTVNYLIAALVTIWGGRLSWHLAKRSQSRKEDPRYEEISRRWKGNYWLRAYFSIFLVQGAMIWIISLPIVLAAGQLLSGYPKLAWIGAAIWLAGFIYETVGDKQLAEFLRNPKNKDKIMQSGLWRYSRHPNYFGEITQWTGISVIVLAMAYGWIGVISPIFLTLLIVYVSGLPLTEKRRAKDKAYQEYKRRTSAIIPWLPLSPAKNT